MAIFLYPEMAIYQLGENTAWRDNQYYFDNGVEEATLT